jgi:Peptidase_C39 like family
MSDFGHDSSTPEHQTETFGGTAAFHPAGAHGQVGSESPAHHAQNFGDHQFGTDPWQLGASDEIGNPSEYQHDWFFQEHNGYCVPSSITQVIDAQSGMSLHNYDLVEAATTQLHLPHTGLTLPQAQEVLKDFNIPSHLESAGTQEQGVEDLANYLHEGRSIILAVNASPLWYGTETADNPGGQADHAVVVSAINAQTGEVTLSDPGTPGGNEETVPLTTFMEAWSASDYSMLVTDHAAGTADEQAIKGVDQVAAASAPSPHLVSAGSVLLPIALVAGGIAGAVSTKRSRRK